MKRNAAINTPAAFSLTELLIAMAVLALLSVGLYTFMIDTSRGLFWGTEKAGITKDVRTFTMRLAAEARSANAAIIYPSFTSEDRDSGGDRRDDGQSGDCLVLVNTAPFPNTDDPEHYTRIIVYYREPESTEDNVGPVRRIEWPTSGSTMAINASENELETVLAQLIASDSGEHPVVVELSRGMSNGRLFTNFRQGKVTVVNGEIYHGNNVKEVTNTYNLSISPRG